MVEYVSGRLGLEAPSGLSAAEKPGGVSLGAGDQGIRLHRQRRRAVPHQRAEAAPAGREVPAAGPGAARAHPPAGHPPDPDVKDKITAQLDHAEDRFAAILR
jgi:hypothetical protein